MNTRLINVLFNLPLNEEMYHKITGVSPQIKLTNVSDLVTAEQKGDSSHEKELDALLAETEVYYGFRLPPNIVGRAPKLKWLQVTSAGVDRLLNDEIWQSSVIITNVSGIHAVPISEIVLEMMLMFVKRAPFCFELKQKRQWQQYTPSILYSKTVGIIGLGNIGREVARLAKAFNMKVIATRRSTKQVTKAKNVDILIPMDQLSQLLANSDFVVISAPLTSQTHELIGESELHTMKPTAYIINIARGRIIDEEVLIRALIENWIAGAGLDVFENEPLPDDSKLWDLPNIIYSPHIAGGQEQYFQLSTEIFCENMIRYLSGQKLINIVNRKNEY